MSASEEPGVEYEERHVHQIYQQIAPHFSYTRYKPWPIIQRFLQELPNGSVGLDIGCGNGKYLAVNPNIYIVGSDRSSKLASIASKHEPHSVVVADVLALPHASRSFDFAISIAVIHHFSTRERRVQAIMSVLDTLRPSGRALIYVWALEQESSRRGWTAEDAQDVMVPWVMREFSSKAPPRSSKGDAAGEPDSGGEVFYRYYHLYARSELEQDIQSAGGKVCEAGYEKDNWWAVAEPSLLGSNGQPAT